MRQLHGNQRFQRSSWIGLALVLPALVLYGIFVLYPIFDSFVVSFYKWIGVGPMKFIGLKNYVDAFKDPVVGTSFLNNVQYTLGIIVFAVLPGLVLAVMLASGVPGRLTFQTVFFIPRLMSQVIVAILWNWMYNPIFGLVNKVLRGMGLGELAMGWLGDPHFALPALTVAGAWTYIGFCIVIFLAALQNTDPSLEEAATIDGANRVQVFFRILLPQLRPIVAMVVIYTVIDSFKVFDLVFILTSGGPGNATEIMATYIYKQAFSFNHFGYGSAITVLLTLFVLVVSIFYQRAQERGYAE